MIQRQGRARLVLVGGAEQGTATLRPLGSRLRAAGYEVALCPQPGRSGERGYTAEAMSSVLSSIRAERAPSHLIGYSLGALTALQVALGHPTLCQSLVLIAGRARTTEYQAALSRALVEVAAKCSPQSFAALTAEMSVSPAVLADPELAADWTDVITGPHDVQTYRWWMEGSLIGDLRPQLADLTVPTLVLSFQEDRLVRPTAADELAGALPRAARVDLGGLGHLGIVEAPGIVAASVLSFLATGVDI